MYKITIRTKILISLIILLALTLGATDFLWYRLIRPTITDHLAATQIQVASRAGDQIDQFILAKERTLIVHSQSAAFLTKNRDLQRLELLTLFTQDKDVDRITLIDSNGKENIKLNRDQAEATGSALLDRSGSEAFVATTFQYGREYIGPVTYHGNQAMMTIAVPIVVPNTSQRLADLTTSTKRDRTAGEILGVLEADIRLDDLLHGIINLGDKKSGILFVVDKNGHVIAHQNPSVQPLTDLTTLTPVYIHVQKVKSGGETSNQSSELIQYPEKNGEEVLGTYVPVLRTGWAVVVEETASAALNEFNRITQFAVLMFFGGLILTFIIAYALSKRLTNSISELVKGAQIIGGGNFDYKPNVNSHDEINDLGNAFYKMAQTLKQSIQSLEKERNLIAAERNKLSVIIAGIQDAVIAVDLQRHITLINRAAEEILNVKGADILGKPLDEVIKLHNGNEEIDVTEYCPIRPATEDSVTFMKEKVRLVHGDREVYTNVVSGQIKEGQSANLGCIVTLHNVSKEMQLEEMKLDFVSMAAHELRTPLTAISGYLAVFMQENLEKFNEEQRSFLNRISLSTQRLTSLVENLLNVSKIERHGLTLSKQRMDWTSHVRDLLTDFENFAREEKVELHFTEPAEVIPPVSIDPLKIDEVISNLVNNAITYTKAGGHVTVVIERRGNEVITSVKDDGPGIPANAIPHLFTKFFRVSGKLEQGSKGTGLGLYISKAIVEMHNGRIWVESDYGHGSTFSFALPIDTTPQ